jgi:hypothetical protein
MLGGIMNPPLMMKGPGVIAQREVGIFRKRIETWYKCTEWAGSWGMHSKAVSSCGYQGNTEFFIDHLISYHGATRELAEKYLVGNVDSDKLLVDAVEMFE